ncbi:DUF167 family protein [Telmatospirillum sp. J64-1]|uniref:DUF167 domain-containing protein n=1 Tax=Telmatospirillum sp. J64-1 TaxID=2502183 RepID=UPI00115E8AFC|nr:DUF167 family protein [Telmatospirillum sp. J64-1]
MSSEFSDLPLTLAADGVRLAVRLTPKASRNRIEGLAAEADGSHILKVSVTAIPEDGKANAALIKLLAKEWKLPKGAFEIVVGATDRRKVVHITGEAEDIRQRLASWIERND